MCLDTPTSLYSLGESVKSHFKMLSLEHDFEKRLSRSQTHEHRAHLRGEQLHDVWHDMQRAELQLED